MTWNQLDDIEDDGWECPRTVSGTMALYEARRVAGDDGDVLHLSYSDGLSIVSVFQQWGSLDPKGLRGYSQQATPMGRSGSGGHADARGVVRWGAVTAQCWRVRPRTSWTT